MATGLDIIVVDDDPQVCEVLARMIAKFHPSGQVHAFSDFLEARTFCFNRGSSVAIFVLDAYLGERTAFDLIEALGVHYPMAAADTVIVTGRASQEMVRRCLDLGVSHLLEKPVRQYALQLAIQSIAAKYLRFAPQLLSDSSFARQVGELTRGRDQ